MNADASHERTSVRRHRSPAARRNAGILSALEPDAEKTRDARWVAGVRDGWDVAAQVLEDPDEADCPLEDNCTHATEWECAAAVLRAHRAGTRDA